MKNYEKYDLDYPSGCIIAKVFLSDCIKVDDEFRAFLHKNNPLVYSSIINHIECKGYGFKLENAEKINSIPVNGKLSIWNMIIRKSENY